MAPNKRNQILAGILALTLLAASGCTSGQSGESTAEYIEPGKVTGSGYKTAQVYEGDFNVAYTSEAMIDYSNKQQLRWDNAEDRYGELLIQSGQTVKKGDVLATFEVTSVSDADILERQLALQEAQTSLNQITQSYENSMAKKRESMEKLTGREYEIASLELQKLQSEYAQRTEEARYQVEKAQKLLTELEEKKADNQLLAPFDGRISYVSRSFQKGNKVDAYTTILEIEDLSSQIITFTNESRDGYVRYLSKVTLTDRLTDKEYEGTVVSCGSVTGSDRDTVIVELDEPVSEEWESRFMKADGFIMQKKQVTLVSSDAVKTEGNSSYVYVLAESNAAYKTYVTIGGISGGIAWVLDGLTPGQTVILE